MVAEDRVLEAKGSDVEEAIQAGLAQLGLNKEDVAIEILDEGSSGFLGIGGRDAVVRLTVVAEEPITVMTDVPEVETAAETFVEDIELPEIEQPDTLTLSAETLHENEVAVDVVRTLLQKMQIEATTKLHQTDPDDLTGEQRWVIDIRGEDMGILIGPRGETLNALQYVARLITGHAIRQRPAFIVDVEGYRARREKALARLAERMANKVVQRGRPMSLEPMPPNERRIIHITLRQDQRVYTESTGEGRHRKVRIFPSRSDKSNTARV